jgi:ribosome-associated protein
MSKRSRKGYYVNGELVAAEQETDESIGEDLDGPIAPSRTARKKASENVRRLADQLIAAPRTMLAGVPLPEILEDAIAEARRLKSFGARRRQTQLVAKIMRRLDEETLEAIRKLMGSE